MMMTEKSHRKIVNEETEPGQKHLIDQVNTTVTLTIIEMMMTEKSHRKIVNEETEPGQKHLIDQVNTTVTLILLKELGTLSI